jgi:hypothetical protein
MQNQFSAVGIPTLYPQVHQAMGPFQTIGSDQLLCDEASSRATGVSYLESARATASRGSHSKPKRKDRKKPYQPPTSAEFKDLSEVYDRAKLTYAADRLLRTTFPELDQKRECAQSALNWAATELGKGKVVSLIIDCDSMLIS